MDLVRVISNSFFLALEIIEDTPESTVEIFPQWSKEYSQHYLLVRQSHIVLELMGLTCLVKYAERPDMEVEDIGPDTFKNNLHSLILGKNRLVPFEDGKVL